MRKFKNTLFLAGVAALIAVPLSVGLGIIAAINEGKWQDRWSNIVSLATISVPEFFIAYLLILVFAVKLRWFPSLSTVFDGMGAWRKTVQDRAARPDADHAGRRAHAAHDALFRAGDHVAALY